MRKAWLASAAAVLLGPLATSGWLLFNPSTALAADGKARCGGTSIVTCEPGATRCVCEDYVGCTSYFSNGTSKETKCGGGDEPILH